MFYSGLSMFIILFHYFDLFCYFASWPRVSVFHVNSCFHVQNKGEQHKTKRKLSSQLVTREQLKRCKNLAAKYPKQGTGGWATAIRRKFTAKMARTCMCNLGGSVQQCIVSKHGLNMFEPL